MIPSSCAREEEALKAIGGGTIDAALSVHVAKCPTCKEIVRTAQWMQTEAQRCEKNLTLPDADLLWWRAHLGDSQSHLEKSHELLEWMEIVSIMVFSAGIAGWIGWNWFAISFLLNSLLTETWLWLSSDVAFGIYALPTLYYLGAALIALVVIGYRQLLPD